MKKDILASLAGVFGSAFLWLLSFKIVAHWLGPSGIGLYSQLRQIIQAATVGATLGGTNAVVQGLSSRDSEPERLRFRVTASRLIGMLGLALALVMLLFAPQFAPTLFSSGSAEIVTALRWTGLAILLNVAATYSSAVLNGYRSYIRLAFTQIFGPLVMVSGLVAIYLWQVRYQPEELALLLVACFGASALAGAWGVARLSVALSRPAGAMETNQTRAFVRFAASNMVAALLTTLTMLLIRSWIIGQRDLASAGLFDAAWTLTFNYTTLLLTACSTIYLPLLTGAKGPAEQRMYMLRAAYLVLAAISVVCYLTVALKEPLLRLLYSPEFQQAGNALTILAAAVILRGISWVYGTMIVATKDGRTLLISDSLTNLGLLLVAHYCLQQYGTIESVAWAFVISNFCYLVFVIEYACHRNILMRRRHIWPLAAAATAPMAICGHAQWLFMLAAPLVSAGALLAYKRVMT